MIDITCFWFNLEYNTDLQQDIDSETSGHFRDTLINLAQVP